MEYRDLRFCARAANAPAPGAIAPKPHTVERVPRSGKVGRISHENPWQLEAARDPSSQSAPVDIAAELACMLDEVFGKVPDWHNQEITEAEQSIEARSSLKLRVAYFQKHWMQAIHGRRFHIGGREASEAERCGNQTRVEYAPPCNRAGFEKRIAGQVAKGKSKQFGNIERVHPRDALKLITHDEFPRKYRAVGNRILGWLKHNGFAVVNYDEIADEEGVSRETVRRIVRELERTGLIYRLQGYETNPETRFREKSYMVLVSLMSTWRDGTAPGQLAQLLAVAGSEKWVYAAAAFPVKFPRIAGLLFRRPDLELMRNDVSRLIALQNGAEPLQDPSGLSGPTGSQDPSRRSGPKTPPARRGLLLQWVLQ